jgi:hypothetical protein
MLQAVTHDTPQLSLPIHTDDFMTAGPENNITSVAIEQQISTAFSDSVSMK